MDDKLKYSCVIVDDNEIDQLAVKVQLQNYSFLRIEGIYASAEEALDAIPGKATDVFFLDIDLPGISGHQLREQTTKHSACIFISSYPEYALESFNYDALDFLVKPIQPGRFAESMERLKTYLDMRHNAGQLEEIKKSTDSEFVIKDGHQKVKINIAEVQYLEALKDYTRIVLPGKKHCVLSMLGHMLEQPPFHNFIRIHRSFAVPRNAVSRMSSTEIKLHGINLPIGRTYKAEVDKLFNQPHQ